MVKRLTDQGRNWIPLKEVLLIDCAVELRNMQNRYFDADFEGNIEEAKFYKNKAKEYQKLVDNGVEHTVNFWGKSITYKGLFLFLLVIRKRPFYRRKYIMTNPNNTKHFNDEALRINRILKRENDALSHIVDEFEDFLLNYFNVLNDEDDRVVGRLQDMIINARSRAND